MSSGVSEKPVLEAVHNERNGRHLHFISVENQKEKKRKKEKRSGNSWMNWVPASITGALILPTWCNTQHVCRRSNCPQMNGSSPTHPPVQIQTLSRGCIPPVLGLNSHRQTCSQYAGSGKWCVETCWNWLSPIHISTPVTKICVLFRSACTPMLWNSQLYSDLDRKSLFVLLKCTILKTPSCEN